jgi:hypothetical protein
MTSQVSLVKAASVQIVRELPSSMKLTAADLETVFSTIAPACDTQEKMRLYIAKCQAVGIHPLSGELTCWMQNTKGGPRLTFVVGYGVFVARATRAGYALRYGVVHENDVWGGWDAVNAAPVKHVCAAGKARGQVLGAWCQAIPKDKSGLVVGQYFDIAELRNAGNPLWGTNPATMAEKAAVARVCRRVCPDLATMISPEERLDMHEDVKPRAEVLKETRARVIEASAEPVAELDTTTSGPTVTAVLEESAPAESEPMPEAKTEAKPQPDPEPTPAKKSARRVKPSDEIVNLARSIRANVELVVKCNVDPVEPEYVYLQLGSPDVTAANVDDFAAHLRDVASGKEVKSLRSVEFYGAIAKKSSKWASDVSKA